MMKLIFLTVALLLSGIATPAPAAIKGCFTRKYDAAHLDKYKGQISVTLHFCLLKVKETLRFFNS
jgi:hypothetical protein